MIEKGHMREISHEKITRKIGCGLCNFAVYKTYKHIKYTLHNIYN
jgi:hypothetical protein